MRINNNIMALNAHRQLSINNTNTQKSLEKLSSGYRINRAGDDAAGLSISEKMRAQIRGLNMASKNAQDGISLIQTAEGALNEVHEILQRMRELAVQAANDTNQDVDRKAIQDEVDQLAVEITRIANNTEFNNKKLLNGDLETVGLTFHIGANKDQNMSLTINDMSSKTLEVQDTVYSKEVISDSKLYVVSRTNDKTIKIQFSASDDNNNPAVTKTTANYDSDTGIITITLKQEAGNGTPGSVADNYGDIKAALESVAEEAGIMVITVDDFNGDATVSEAPQAVDIKGASDWELSDDISSKLGILGINVSTKEAANDAIDKIDQAIRKVSTERSKLGAVQNRLEHTIKNLDTSAENLAAAESRIRDVDMAKEMMEFTKQNILQQAATAMLAQANMAPQTVLKLLG